MVLTPCPDQDVPKDTVVSIICNTTVIIYFSSLEYVFVGYGIEGFFFSFLFLCWALFLCEQKQICRNSDLLRVHFCPCCSHWQSSYWGLQDKQETIPILPPYSKISWISFTTVRPRIPPANLSVAEIIQRQLPSLSCLREMLRLDTGLYLCSAWRGDLSATALDISSSAEEAFVAALHVTSFWHLKKWLQHLRWTLCNMIKQSSCSCKWGLGISMNFMVWK